MTRKNTTPEDLGIDLADGKPQQLYRWFLACLLFARPIQQEIAADAYQSLIRKGHLTSPGRFEDIQREPLRKLLDDAHYARYDYVTADQLHESMRRVVEEYGSVSHMVKDAESMDDLRKRLLGFKGLGDLTADIFLNELPKEFNGRK